MKYAAFIQNGKPTMQGFDKMDINIAQEGSRLLCSISVHLQEKEIATYSRPLNIECTETDIQKFKALALLEISKLFASADVVPLGEAIQIIGRRLKESLTPIEIKPVQPASEQLGTATDGQPEVVVYVDGSYNPKTEEAGWGFFGYSKSEQFQKNGRVDKSRCAKFCQSMSGELAAAKEAVKFCWKKGYKNICIYHDHFGISDFAEQHSSVNPEIDDYITFINRMRRDMEITFQKVKSHSNNQYNELVDKLAKTAVGL